MTIFEVSVHGGRCIHFPESVEVLNHTNILCPHCFSVIEQKITLKACCFNVAKIIREILNDEEDVNYTEEPEEKSKK